MAYDLAHVELERDEAERKYGELWGALTPDARDLLIPGGALDVPTTQALAAVARRPLLRRLALGPLRLGYRVKAGRRRPHAENPITSPESVVLHFGPANVKHMEEYNGRPDSERLTRELDGWSAVSAGSLASAAVAHGRGRWPSPPDELIDRLVSGFWNESPQDQRALFLETGRRSLEDLERALAMIGDSPEGHERILEFGCGCGCGRAMRWMEELGDTRTLVGTDIDERAIGWAAKELPFARFDVNEGLPLHTLRRRRVRPDHQSQRLHPSGRALPGSLVGRAAAASLHRAACSS